MYPMCMQSKQELKCAYSTHAHVCVHASGSHRLVIPCRTCAARDTVILQCLLVSVCTSHSSLVSGYITQYFEQLGFERHGIEANRNGFSRIRFVTEKKRGKT